MAYSLIHRTGLSRGRVYNSVGDNLTEHYPGAGNQAVGPWVRDYAGLYSSADWSANFDSEFSGIIMDGRAIVTGQDGTDGILFPDFDEDESLSDRGSIVGRDTQYARLKGLMLRLYHTCPNFKDGVVWALKLDGTSAVQVGPLDQWLEDEATVGQHPMRHALRVPCMWALYRVQLGPNYESLAQMIVENSALPTGQTGQLAYGPVGMLTALHGVLYAAGHATRLYEPNLGIIPVERGMYDIPYSGALDDDQVDPDFVLPQEELDPIPADDGVAILNTPAQRARGRINTTSIASSKDVTARAGEVYLWHWQTCPVRIRAPQVEGTGHLVIGNGDSPFLGPYVHLTYHELSARFSVR